MNYSIDYNSNDFLNFVFLNSSSLDCVFSSTSDRVIQLNLPRRCGKSYKAIQYAKQYPDDVLIVTRTYQQSHNLREDAYPVKIKICTPYGLFSAIFQDTFSTIIFDFTITNVMHSELLKYLHNPNFKLKKVLILNDT